MVRQTSFQVGERAYLAEHRVKVRGRYRLLGDQPQRVCVTDLDDHSYTIACDEASLQSVDSWRLDRLRAKANKWATQREAKKQHAKL